MGTDQDLLNAVLSKSKLHEKESLAQKIYRDEPILMTASQMANFTPPIYRKMREIAKNACSDAENVIFYKQAKFMEFHEDNYEHQVEFHRFYPTYSFMSDAQLRSYFTWRTKVKKGDIQKASLSFAYIYIYELLNGIGCDNDEDGFLKLLHFFDQYRTLDYHVETYMNRWLRDYCIYYGLDETYFKMIPAAEEKPDILKLMDALNQSDDCIFEALLKISSYNIKTSRFFKVNQEACISVTAEVIKRLNEYYNLNSLQEHQEYFFGSFITGKRMLFAGAVFYNRLNRDGFCCKVSEVEEYSCVKGQWYFRQFMLYNGNLQRTGELLRTIDSCLREKYNFKHALKKGSVPDKWEDIIVTCIDNYVIRKEYENAPRIEIDLRLLNTIRSDAAVTQDRLLIYNEDVVDDVADTDAEGDENVKHSQLSSLHVQFLMKLIAGESYCDMLKENNTTTQLLCDEINDLLFEEINDTVITFEGDMPVIYEEYIDFLKGFIDI